jgi:tetratricopeptide (TPR) repeat protein
MRLMGWLFRGLADLTAKPIPRERMDLLWLNPDEFDLVGLAAAEQHQVIIGPEKGGPRRLTVTSGDLDWARRVDKVAAKAVQASSERDYAGAIKFYRQALKLAPGADIYLMSIGSCYANMRRTRKALAYLKRAHEISPQNERIRRNLRALEALLARQRQRSV